jgi:hypothetical protein
MNTFPKSGGKLNTTIRFVMVDRLGIHFNFIKIAQGRAKKSIFLIFPKYLPRNSNFEITLGDTIWENIDFVAFPWSILIKFECTIGLSNTANRMALFISPSDYSKSSKSSILSEI